MKRAFCLGDRVRKCVGYSYPGVVIGVVKTLDGFFRYVVEADHPDFKGMLHIYNDDQLELRE